ncbi:MAG TPA: hypothetical protein VE053_13675 [Allosphingosinicella sp.]|nr:hypothetical protein [Allosphingosinicella sp.]
MRFALRFGLLAMVPSGMAVGAPAPTITKAEIRSDPPNVTDRQLKDIVWSLFEKQDHRRKEAPTRPLSRVVLRTRTQATRVPDLCRYDSMRIEFERVNPKDTGADAPVRPVGLTSSSNFTFLSAPSADYENALQGSLASVALCSKVTDDRHFFTARSEKEATDGFRAWLALLNSIRAGRKVPLECSLAPLDAGPCESVISALTPDQISEIEICDSESAAVCHKIYAGDRLITIVTTGRVHPGPPPGQLVSAKLETLIVLAHEIID